MAPPRAHLRSIAAHNWTTLRKAPLAELSGAVGDLGTLLPLLIALALRGCIDLGSTLVFSGLANILTGVVFGVPLPVQPMKAIAAIAISQNFTKSETAAAGLTMGIVLFILSATGLLRWLNRIVPVPVVKGIQVGAGLSLVLSAGATMILPLAWSHPTWDNRIWAIGAFLVLLIAQLFRRFPYALVVFIFGLIVAATAIHRHYDDGHFHAGLWHPHPFVPSGPAWRRGAIDAALPQLPLTTLNSVLAVTSLCASLFPDNPPTPSTTAIGFSVALSNLVGCWFGAMPICHGSGGLAGQYRFGARSGASVIILGLVKLLLGLFIGEGILPLLRRFPLSLLGIMVIAAGVELAKVGQSVGEKRDLWEQTDEAGPGDDGHEDAGESYTVMLVTVAGCLACRNEAVGFVAGMVWVYGLMVREWVPRIGFGGRSIRLDRGGERAEEDEALLNR